MANQPVYKVIFQNGSQVFEVFARQIYQSDMWGFIEVEEFVFGERSQILVDPGEEKLKNEFAGVKRSYIPMQAIIRIDEVDKEGSSKVSNCHGCREQCHQFPLCGFSSRTERRRRVGLRAAPDIRTAALNELAAADPGLRQVSRK